MTKKSQRSIMDDWNNRFPIGTIVCYWPTIDKFGPGKLSKTRSKAILACSGHAVVWLEGVRGYYSLEAISAVINCEKFFPNIDKKD